MRWFVSIARSVLFAAFALGALGALLPPPALAVEPAQGRDAAATTATTATTATAPAVTPVAGERWWSDAVFYEIFVRSFADSDGDGIGDFRGLTAKLDVLNDGDPKTTTDLGITGIWLMPIHASPSYHGYDVIDYRSVNPDYGTLADFDHFIAEAKKRGIRVIIDFVMNHSSREHPWFIDAQTGASAKHRDFYLWRSADPGWTQPWSKNGVWHAAGGSYYYGLFWGGMPDLNLGNPAVEVALVDAMRFWLDRGVAGFRVDAAKHFFESEDGVLVDQPESHAFVERVRATLRQTRPDALLVGEIWSDNAAIAPYVAEGRFQLAFGFGTAGAVIESARDGLRVSFEQALRAGFFDRRREAPFLANHDMARTMRQLGGDRGAMRVAAAALLGLPGTPFIYYGEEIGMQGGAGPEDEAKRTPMRWVAGAGHGFTQGKPWHDSEEAAGVDVASQRGAAGSWWSLYRDLITLRRAERALVGGDVMLPVRTGGGRGLSVIVRSGGGERVLVVYNFSAAPSEGAQVEVARGEVMRGEVVGAPRVLLAEGLSGAVEWSLDGTGIVVPAMAGRGFAFIRLDAVGGR